uniref:HAT C-terminal dimerisation domain-containing protein n=1 Tax=Oryza brachyantha TaxID=4533 RepID=J3N883_ORYBR
MYLTPALPFTRAFKALAQEDPQYVHLPSDNEWGMARKLCSMLQVFHKATVLVSGSKYPTANLYFHQIWEVKKMLEIECLNSHHVIASMVCQMTQKLEKYWNLSFLKICIPVILDPRFKLSFLEYRLKQGLERMEADEYLKKIETTIRELFTEYSSKMGNLEGSDVVDLIVDGSNPWSDWGKHVNAHKRSREKELDKYLEEEVVSIGDDDFDILQYWKIFSTKYPVLAQMARDVLAIPASTVPTESAFSTGGRVISDYRSSLHGETVQALICLQDWIKAEDSQECKLNACLS